MFVNSGMKVWKREEQFMNNVKVQTKLIIVMLTTIVAREFDTLKFKKVPQSLETGLFFCQIFIFII